MDELKKALEDLPHIAKVFITKAGEWYFHKPADIEVQEKSREEILGTATADNSKKSKKPEA